MAIVFSSRVNGEVENIFTPSNYYTGKSKLGQGGRPADDQATLSSGVASSSACATSSAVYLSVSLARLLPLPTRPMASCSSRFSSSRSSVPFLASLASSVSPTTSVALAQC